MRGRRALLALAGVAVLWWRLRPFRVVVRGESMRPLLDDDDFGVAVRPRRLRRGDVVVMRRSDGLEVCKRVVGLPGERVRVERGRVSVNGTAIPEPYASGEGEDGGWALAADEYVVLGDNRARSTDSRAFGPVREGAIVGVVRVRYWPRPRLV